MNKRMKSKRHGIRWGWVFAIGGVLLVSAWLGSFVFSHSDSDRRERRKGRIEDRGGKDGKKQRDRKRREPANATKPSAPDETAEAEMQHPVPKPPKEIVKISTNSFGQVNELYRSPDGRLHRRIYNARKPIFDNASDQILSMAVNARPGARIAPMPNMRGGNLDETFLKSLETPIRIDPDDSDEVKARKRNVAEAREALREMMAEGYTFAEALNAHRDEVNKNYAMRDDARKILRDLIAEGDESLAREYLEKANELLRNSGIDEISMPDSDDDEDEW